MTIGILPLRKKLVYAKADYRQSGKKNKRLPHQPANDNALKIITNERTIK
jgi:hypothetical protein